ncbi:Thymidylate kinase [Myotisia sp. PD_48]|nr:Thymidylate kinase [Myotisia sp. PD_48]
MDKTQSKCRGVLIVFEGLDRAGKSTQAAGLLLKLREQGQVVKLIRFPNRTTPLGEMIDRYLQGELQLDDHAVHLLFSANRWELAKEIEEQISNGVTLILDRYSYSGAVYSAAKEIDNLSFEWAWQPEIGLPRPDIWFFLNITPEVAQTRGDYGLERYERIDMQTKAGRIFMSLCGIEHNEEMRIIDASKEKQEISDEILAEVLACKADIVGRPLRFLGILSPKVAEGDSS